jgi:hypothetical protein
MTEEQPGAHGREVDADGMEVVVRQEAAERGGE